LEAIDDLTHNYWRIFENLVGKKDFINYKDAKINMYLYQARINKQFMVAYRISIKLLMNKLSFMNFLTFIKLPVHHLVNTIKL
jgi:hypothetical protein